MQKMMIPRSCFIKTLNRLSAIKGTFLRLLRRLREIRPYSEDTAYKWHFITHVLPKLHEDHERLQHANCAFCVSLTRSRCHPHCFQCGAGSYVYCSPVLPGILNCEDSGKDREQASSEPWYYKKPCTHFRRLGAKMYWRNLYSPFSWVTIYNFEVLQGLLFGLSASEKPCHVCATVDYGIYQHCSTLTDFQEDKPCMKIAEIMASQYEKASRAS